jgi:16S rRNA processing protein RimM
LKLAGIESREDARSLRGAYLEALERNLESPGEGEYYRFQLVGLSVRSSDGRDLGHVTDILSTAGNDVYIVQGPLGEILVPAIDDIVQIVDVEGGAITVEVVPGLLPDSR